MHDLAVAGAFILIVLSPCFVAARTGIGNAVQPKEFFQPFAVEDEL